MFEQEVAKAERAGRAALAGRWQARARPRRRGRARHHRARCARRAARRPDGDARARASGRRQRRDHVIRSQRAPAPAQFQRRGRRREPGQWELIVDLYRGDDARVPLAQPRHRCNSQCHDRGARPLALCQAGRRRHARHGPGGRRRRLRRLHRAHRGRGEAAAGRRRGAAQLHQPPAARRLAPTARSSRRTIIATLEEIGYRGHPFVPLRAEQEEAAEARRLTRCLAVAGLRRHEHHAAVGVGVVRQRHRHHAGDARLLPLGLGADRAAGGGLCRPAVLRERLARAARAHHQHGRADLARRHRSRSACRWSRPPTTPSTPISIPPSCCCSSCWSGARSITPCGARRARSPAIWRR